MVRILAAILALFFLLAPPAPAQSEIYGGHVRVDGGQKVFAIDLYYPMGEQPFMALDTLAREMRWDVRDDGRSPQVTVQGRPVQAARHRGRTFVSARSLADALNYRLEQRPEARFIDLWSQTAVSAGSATVSIQSRKKWDRGVNRDVSYDLTLTVRNDSDAVLPLTPRNFVLVDRAGRRYDCEGIFNVGVPAHRESTFSGPYFTVPYQHDLVEVLLVNPSGEVVARARW